MPSTCQIIIQTFFNRLIYLSTKPVDISVNRSAQCLVADKYQDCYATEVLKQLTRGVKLHVVKVDVTLATVNLTC